MLYINNFKNILYQIVIIGLLLISISLDASAEILEWPRELALESGLLTIYQPQVDAMENDVLSYRAAVAYEADGSSEPVFGAAWFRSRVEVDRDSRSVHVVTLEVTDTRFPEGSEHVRAEFEAAIKSGLPTWSIDLSLDELLTSLAASEEEIAAAAGLSMEPPEIIYRDHPALLVVLDGDPVYREIEDSSYLAIINTPYPLISNSRKSKFYLNAGKDVWYEAKKATGPYEFDKSPPSKVEKLVDQSQVADSGETVGEDNAPEIIVRTGPAELIVTDGKARFEPLVDDLLVISNSASDVFMHVTEQQYFVVLSGRWFTAGSMQGPWANIRSDELPAVFRQIPGDSDQADARTYVAGTDEAREAVMDAQIPQTAAIEKGRVDIEVSYDGAPRFVGIEGVDLEYAENTGSTVLRSGGRYYLVEDAVWYVGSAATGPWEVAESRPEGVESIPPQSPVYNVKYVYIYESTPDVVYVGYTPGYTGSYVYHTTVVYGTGWYYRPWISPYYYYPHHATWGFHVNYNPWTGWGFGISWGWGPFHVGFHTGGYWHHHHHWHHHHPGYWGPGGYRPGYGGNVNIGNINIGEINVNRPGGIQTRDNNLYRDKAQAARVRDTRDTAQNRGAQDRIADKAATIDRGKVADKVATVDRDKVADKVATVDRDKVANKVSTMDRDKVADRVATADRNNVYTDRSGNVYRKDKSGWQMRDQGKWSPSPGVATRPATRDPVSRDRDLSPTRQNPAYRSPHSGYSQPSNLDRQQYSRQRSSSRNQQYRQQRSMPGRSFNRRR